MCQAAENKFVEAKDALAVFKTALGDKVSDEEFDTVGLHFAGACGSSGDDHAAVRCGHVEVRVGRGPREDGGGIEAGGGDLGEGHRGCGTVQGLLLLGLGTLTLLRDTKMHLKRTGSAVCWGRTGAVRRH